MTALPPRLRNASRVGALQPINLRQVRVGAYGPQAKLLRILMTNACSFNCHYCPMRRDRDLPRTLLKPQEMARIFLDAVARGWASGLFITTGIPGCPTKVMDDLITTLERLRVTHKYRGYVHVKIVPGADDAQVDRITSLANRVSINLETPCGDTLSTIAPDKQLETTLVALRRAQRGVIGARNEEREGRPHDQLLPGGTAGNLSLSHDPKLAWALAHPERFPLDVRAASFTELLRVPGVGPLVARRIVEGRRTVMPRGIDYLKKPGVVVTRALGFLTINGRRLAAARWREQLSLWAPENDVGRRDTIYKFSPGTCR